MTVALFRRKNRNFELQVALYQSQFVIAVFQNQSAAVIDRRYSSEANWKWHDAITR
jgi:hypothetical protein